MLNQTAKKEVQVDSVKKQFCPHGFHFDFNFDFVLITFKDVK